MTTRRSVLRVALLSTPLSRCIFAGSHEHFWNVKEPADWNDKETSEILTHSPWAKQAVVDNQLNTRSDSGMGGLDSSAGAGGGMRGNAGVAGTGGSGGGGMQGGSREGMEGARGAASHLPQSHILVRWESALPVLAALRKPRPTEFDSYIISMTGMPLPPPNPLHAQKRRTGIEGGFQESTSLQRKGEDPVSPIHAELVEEQGVSCLRFTFPSIPHPIRLDEKEVIFVSAIGHLTMRARFSPKEMTYRNHLAV